MDTINPHHVLGITYASAGIFVFLIGFASGLPWLLVLAVFGARFCVSGPQVGANALAASYHPTASRATGVSCAAPDQAVQVRTTSGPAANPTGSNGPASGQPMNTNTSVPTGIMRGPAQNPTGSETPASGQPSNMNTSVSGGATTAPPKDPTGSAGYQY
jgi:hypothetical protein